MKEYIGLRNDNSTIEYNARFLLGDKRSEELEVGKWYTYTELLPANFLRTNNQTNEAKHKWRRISND